VRAVPARSSSVESYTSDFEEVAAGGSAPPELIGAPSSSSEAVPAGGAGTLPAPTDSPEAAVRDSSSPVAAVMPTSPLSVDSFVKVTASGQRVSESS
jgi:hypothetical protein